MPNPAYVASISANGKVFTGWKSLTLRREFTDGVGTFQFSCSDANNEAASLLPGAACQIKLGGQTALTGWITTRGFSYDAGSHDVIIGGKSVTADAADSSVASLGSLNGYGAEQIAKGALQPHNINLKVVNPPPNWSKVFPFFAVNPGETVLEHISRALFMRGAFLWDDESGNLCVGQGPGPSAAVVADLQEKKNILRMTGQLDDQQCVSLYNIYAQQPSTDQDWPARNSQASVTDSTQRANRTRVVHAPNPADSDDAQSYANLLAARSGWATVELEVTVAGWLRPDGQLWQLTNNVSVYSPMALPNGTGTMKLGTKAITFAQDRDNGTTTTLSLIRPEFLQPMGRTGNTSNADGSFVDDPKPATVVPPDTSKAA